MNILNPINLSEFLDLFEKYSNNGSFYYRGQSNVDWEVIPGLARNIKLRSLNLEVLTKIESKIIELFKKAIRDNILNSFISSFNTGSYDESWILLMAAQHYGLPTRLLDFSNDKYTALQFAVADLNHLDKDGALLIHMDVLSSAFDINCPTLNLPFQNDLKETFFFQAPSFWNANTPFSEHRKIIQGSKFLYINNSNLRTCLSLQPEHKNDLIKINIPKNVKPFLIKYLINNERMAYDLYAGKDENDYHAAILKQGFMDLNENDIESYLNQINY